MCPPGSFCDEGSSQETRCPSGTFQTEFGAKNQSACLPCAENTYQFQAGQTSCLPCSKSAEALPGSSVCKCIGSHRSFQMTDGYCICEPRYESINLNGESISDEDGEYDCQPMVHPRCSAGETRSDSGKCIPTIDTNCSSACSDTPGELIPSLGICQCYSDLDSICDAECRQNSIKLRVNANTGSLETYDPTTGEIVEALGNSSTAGFLNEAHCSPSTIPGESLSCHLLSIIMTSNGFTGSYDPPILKANTSTNATSGDRRRRRRLDGTEATSSATSGVLNPMICMLKGEGIMFDLSGSPESYPVYTKDSMLNTNPDFDYGAFRKLSVKAKLSSAVTAFAFTFSTPGIYVFSNNLNPDAKMVIAIMEDGITCPTEGAIVPLTEQSLVSVNTKQSKEIILAPNWILISALLASLFGLVAAVIFGLYYFKRRSWSRKALDNVAYRKRGKFNSVHSKGSIFKKKAVQEPEDIESPVGQKLNSNFDRWDDEDLDVREIIERIQHHHETVHESFENQHSDVKNVIQLLQNEANELKRLLATSIVAQGTGNSGMSPTSKVDQDKNRIQKHVNQDLSERQEYDYAQVQVQDDISNQLDILKKFFQPGDRSLANSILEEWKITPESSAKFQSCIELVNQLNEKVANSPQQNDLQSIRTAEKSRQDAEATVWSAYPMATRKLLSPPIHTLRQQYQEARTNYDQVLKSQQVKLENLAASKTFPTIISKLNQIEEAFAPAWAQAKEKQNPTILRSVEQKYRKKLAATLKDMDHFVTQFKKENQKLVDTLAPAQKEMLQAQDALNSYLKREAVMTITQKGSSSEMKRIQSIVHNPNSKLEERHAAETELFLLKESSLQRNEINALKSGLRAEDEIMLQDMEIRDIERMDDLRREFIKDLEENGEELSEEDRQTMLNDFNEDMIKLEASLLLERQKQEEELRNRLMARSLNREQKQKKRHQDEIDEEVLLEKQAAERRMLEQKLKLEMEQEEQALDDEYNQELSELTQTYLKQPSDSNSIDYNSKIKQTVGEMKASTDELQRSLEQEAAQRKAVLKERIERKRNQLRSQGKNEQIDSESFNKIAQEEEQEIQSIDLDIESKLQQIHSEHDQNANEMQNHLKQERIQRKKSLHDRIARKRQKILAQAENSANPNEKNGEMIERALQALDKEEREETAVMDAENQMYDETVQLVERKQKEHEEKNRALQATLQQERQVKERTLKERLEKRRQQKLKQLELAEETPASDEQLKNIEQEINREQREEMHQLAEDEESAIKAQETANVEELQALQLSMQRQSQEAEAKTAAEVAKKLESLNLEHSAEVEALEKTLGTEKKRRMGNLQDRLAQRRRDKQHAMEEQGLKFDEQHEMEEELAEKERLEAELQIQVEQAMAEEKAKQEHDRMELQERMNVLERQKKAQLEAFEAAKAAKMSEVHQEYEQTQAKEREVQSAEYKSKKSKLQQRLEAKKRAAKEAKEKHALALAKKQRQEAMELQSRLEASALEEEWQEHIESAQEGHSHDTSDDDHMNDAVQLEAQQSQERQALARKQEQEAQRVAEETEAEAAATLARESTLEERRLQAEIAQKQKELEDKFEIARQSMVKEDLERIQGEFHDELNTHAKRVQEEQKVKKNDLKRRLELKKQKRTEELKRHQESEKRLGLEKQQKAKAELLTSNEREKELVLIRELFETKAIPTHQLQDLIETVLSKRHSREITNMRTKQYTERTSALRDTLETLMIQKTKEKKDLMLTWGNNGSSLTSETEKQTQLRDIDLKYAARQDTLEADMDMTVNTHHAQQHQVLQDHQLEEIVVMTRHLRAEGLVQEEPREAQSPENHNNNLALVEIQDYREKLKTETATRVSASVAEKNAQQLEISQTYETQLADMDSEFTTQLEREKNEQHSRMERQRVKLWTEQAELLKVRLSDNQNTSKEDEEKLTLQFEREYHLIYEQLEQEHTQQEAELIAQLGLRRRRRRRRLQHEMKQKLNQKEHQFQKHKQMLEDQAKQAFMEYQQRQLKKLQLASSSSSVLPRSTSSLFQSALAKTKVVTALQGPDGVSSPEEIREQRMKRKSTAAAAAGKNESADTDETSSLAGPNNTAIQNRLQKIETLIQQMNENNNNSNTSSSLATVMKKAQTAMVAAHYGTQLDASREPEGHLELVTEDKLNPRAKKRFAFGKRLLVALQMDGQVELVPVSALPAPVDRTKASAFSNSMVYDPSRKCLYIRTSRMDNISEFLSIVIHSLAHIKVNPDDFSNDADQSFVTEYHRLMGRSFQEMFQELEFEARGEPTAVASALASAPALAPPLENPHHTVPQYFSSEQLQTRYAALDNFLTSIESTARPAKDRDNTLEESLAGKSAQDQLDLCEKQFLGYQSEYADLCETLDVLKDALAEAQEHPDQATEQTELSRQISDLTSEMHVMYENRSEVSKRCDDLRKSM